MEKVCPSRRRASCRSLRVCSSRTSSIDISLSSTRSFWLRSGSCPGGGVSGTLAALTRVVRVPSRRASSVSSSCRKRASSSSSSCVRVEASWICFWIASAWPSSWSFSPSRRARRARRAASQAARACCRRRSFSDWIAVTFLACSSACLAAASWTRATAARRAIRSMASRTRISDPMAHSSTARKGKVETSSLWRRRVMPLSLCHGLIRVGPVSARPPEARR